MMRKFSGQRIQEGVDYVRVPSLQISSNELSHIPEPPSFSNFDLEDDDGDVENWKNERLDECYNSDDNEGTEVEKVSFHNRKNLRMSRTIKLQKRLSSIPVQLYNHERILYDNGKNNAGPLHAKSSNNNMSVRHRSLGTPLKSLQNIIEEEDYLQESGTTEKRTNSVIVPNTQQNIQLFPVMIDQQIPTTHDDAFSNLYGEDEDSILGLNKKDPYNVSQIQPTKSSKSIRSKNEILFDEILAGYMNKPLPKRKHWLSDCNPDVTSKIKWQERAVNNDRPKEHCAEEVQPRIPSIQITLPPNLDEKMNMRLRSLTQTLSPTSPPSVSTPVFGDIIPNLQPPFAQRVKHQSFGTFDGSIEGESSENDMSSLGDKLYLSSPEAKACTFYSDSEVEEKECSSHSPLKSLIMEQGRENDEKYETLGFVRHKLQKNFVQVPVPLIFDDESEDDSEDMFSFTSSIYSSVYSEVV
ncbi:hypothetical protein ACO0QE_002348 [Hanseniaspora vineae]